MVVYVVGILIVMDISSKYGVYVSFGLIFNGIFIVLLILIIL